MLAVCTTIIYYQFIISLPVPSNEWSLKIDTHLKSSPNNKTTVLWVRILRTPLIKFSVQQWHSAACRHTGAGRLITSHKPPLHCETTTLFKAITLLGHYLESLCLYSQFWKDEWDWDQTKIINVKENKAILLKHEQRIASNRERRLLVYHQFITNNAT